MMRSTFRVLGFSLMLLAAPVAMADADQQLYDPAPPADAAFVRVLNANPSGEISATIGDARFGNVAYPGLSPYMVVKQGEQTLKAGSASETINVEAGKYYTLAVAPDGKVVTLKDAIIEQPSKAYVYFYNFSDAAKASLRATKQNMDIAGDVAPNRSMHREMNALTLAMAITADGKTVQTFPSVALKRRSGTSFVLAGTGDAKKAVWIENKIQR
jgi:alginate O-acetyltransferase complex protein AlgF